MAENKKMMMTVEAIQTVPICRMAGGNFILYHIKGHRMVSFF